MRHERELLERARESLKHALAPFKPAYTKAEAARLLADIEQFLEPDARAVDGAQL